jgi:hypothetical protein
LLGEQLLKDYHSWVQQQPQASLSREWSERIWN